MNDLTRKCPVMHGGFSNRDWWLTDLPLELLAQHDRKTNPHAPDYHYRQALQTLDVSALKKEVRAMLTTLVAG